MLSKRFLTVLAVVIGMTLTGMVLVRAQGPQGPAGPSHAYFVTSGRQVFGTQTVMGQTMVALTVPPGSYTIDAGTSFSNFDPNNAVENACQLQYSNMAVSLTQGTTVQPSANALFVIQDAQALPGTGPVQIQLICAGEPVSAALNEVSNSSYIRATQVVGIN
jgi:hypothetical protein